MSEKISNKIIGYLLLIIGLFTIVYSAVNVYDVFKGRTKPFPLFNFDPVALDFSNFVEGAPQNSSLKQELIAANVLNDPTNYIAHLMLMGFLVTIGFKIATLGVMLVRTIKVNLKEEKQSILAPPANKPMWK